MKKYYESFNVVGLNTLRDTFVALRN